MRLLTSILTALILSSCAHTAGISCGSSRLLFPESQFSREGTTCVLDDTQALLDNKNKEELKEFFKAAGGDYDSEAQDPFIRENLPFVEFQANKPGKEIADYLYAQFLAEGWKEQRGILLMEYTNCGGDWLRVFSHGTKQVLIHVCGPLDPITGENNTDYIVMRTITYRFIGAAPQEILGKKYKSSQQSGAGYPPQGVGSPDP